MSNPFGDDEDNKEEWNEAKIEVAFVPVVEAVTCNPFGDDDDNNDNVGIRIEKIPEAKDNISISPPLPPKNRYNNTQTNNESISPPQLPKRNDNQGMSIARRRSSGQPLTFGIANDTKEKLPETLKTITELQRDPTSGLVKNPFDEPNHDKTRKVSLTFDKVNTSLLPLSADLRNILLHGWEINTSVSALKECNLSASAVQKLYTVGKSQSNSSSLANLWKPPILVRIGSWMPGADNNSTGYIVNLTIGAAVNISWQVVMRYSKFLEFFNEVQRECSKSKVDINIINNKFPQDRLTNWLKGMTDEVRNSRKKALDSWLRELFSTPMIMTIPAIFNLLLIRFEVTENRIRAITDKQLIERATFNVQDSLINPSRYNKKS